MSKALFDAIRTIKGSPLTQADVDIVNAALGQKPPTLAEHIKVSQEGINLIHSFESLMLKAYKDPGSSNGLPITIGWGSTSDEDGLPIKLGDVWTKERADRVFARDLAKFAKGVADALRGAPTKQSQFDAMVSLAYNIGLDAFRKSTLLKRHLAGDYAGAKAQFGAWVYNDGKKLNGLVRRRKAEADLYGAS